MCEEEGSSARLLIGSLQAMANNVKGGRSVLSQMRRRAGETIMNHSRRQVCLFVHAIHMCFRRVYRRRFDDSRMPQRRPAEGQPAKEGEKPAVSS